MGIFEVGDHRIIVDDEFDDILKQNSWYVAKVNQRSRTFYVRFTWKPYENQYLHIIIMKPSNGQEVDHVNGNGLDNRRENLRLSTRSQNSANISKKGINRLGKGHSSQYKGVHYKKSTKKWCSKIGVNGNHIYLGHFPYTPEGEIQAAIAYDKAAIKHFGEFANTNFPKENYL